ncbi:4-(cytidine 5'-diphospho)-2-C-methyl-D-erythritol kinase [Lentibacter sp. XHP0401]|uniref:4-(cytidine 5'-diphospho)-2-C-methyl-D-erythritol kinase n=1 Tax=Lentibacter sp. XHP0401 TaxID=2984334 RepID=UPI0021E83E5B|nr:4-(cytidine 5'-diphospho)-2-C-methyl-D-erythritol kinase [Lentibacter sp. XHP0401]MCV2892947.1 4-(cytidine 5'-diphospho)-2-C-methyl-D-erythritol kinase [Lentibacter sp. XHP0401]
MTRVEEAFAPAKVNLALHVTGQRADGYHLLESLVVFANIGDCVTARLADEPSLHVHGPLAAGVPTGPGNLVLKAAAWAGHDAAFELEKNLPAAAGIGGGSSDAAAALRALEALTGRAVDVTRLAELGADLPVCYFGRSCLMRGVGEQVEGVALPRVPAVLANPRVEVATPKVFAALALKDNPPMPVLPVLDDVSALVAFLANETRNDLEAPALALAPVIGEVIDRLWALEGARLARMSGSGATCFALFDEIGAAEKAAADLKAQKPDWWISAVWLS